MTLERMTGLKIYKSKTEYSWSIGIRYFNSKGDMGYGEEWYDERFVAISLFFWEIQIGRFYAEKGGAE